MSAYQIDEVYNGRDSMDKDKNEDEDLNAFKQAMQNVTPLQTYNNINIKQTKNTSVAIRKLKQQESLPSITKRIDTFSDQCEMETVLAADTLTYQANGIQKNLFKKLRRGKLTIADELDLHGLNITQSRKLLHHFLELAQPLPQQCVCIVHGKGHRSKKQKPILKMYVNNWLQQHNRVLAFHSALPADGGTGAVYVLLKRQNL